MNWRRFLRRAQTDADQQQELESYVEITTDEYIASGMVPGEARAAARRKLGNSTLVREEVYRMNSVSIIESLTSALRHWMRTLRREPVFVCAAVLTLALGIGATTAIFSVVNGILIKPLPYPHSEQLVSVRHQAPGLDFGLGWLPLSPSMLFTYREQNRVFESFGLWDDGNSVVNLGEPEQVYTLRVSYGSLQAIGVQPMLGRLFSQEDDTPGAPETVIISYGFWQGRFGGAEDIIGRSMIVDGRARQIIGVMPQNFEFLTRDAKVMAPMRFERAKQNMGNLSYQGLARLREGVDLQAANADIARMLPIWMRSWPTPLGVGADTYEKARIRPDVRSSKEEVVGDIGGILWILMGAVGLVLLIACANVANLLLVKAEARQQEWGIRMALGASRSQILRDTFAESLLLGVAGGALGLSLAYGALRLLKFLDPANLPRLREIMIDGSVVIFAVATSVAACLLAGLIPALKQGRAQIGFAVRSAGRSLSASRERHRARNVLVTGQVALALVLLVTAGLMIRTLQELRKVQPGFTKPEQILSFRVTIPRAQIEQPERVIRAQNDIVDKLAAIPGVEAVGFSSSVPMDRFTSGDPIYAENATEEPGKNPPVRRYKFVSPGFLKATGTRLIAGRDLIWSDIYDRRYVVLVSENLAQEMWGSPSAALGKRIREIGAKARWREVVGVTEDVRDDGVQKASPATVYWPVAMENFVGDALSIKRNVAFAIRSPQAGTEGFLKEVRRSVESATSGLALARIGTLQQMYKESMAQTSFTLIMLAVAGSMALFLGATGVYGVIAYTVAQRRREVGIRMALGAQSGAVKGMFLRHGLVLTGVGIGLGWLAAAGLSNVTASLLFGVKPLDLFTYVATAAILLVAAMAATYIPARQAASVDPMETLRGE